MSLKIGNRIGSYGWMDGGGVRVGEYIKMEERGVTEGIHGETACSRDHMKPNTVKASYNIHIKKQPK